MSPRSLRASLLALDDARRAEALAGLSEGDAEALLFDWSLWARDNQLPPPGNWLVWLLLAGRGFGKTRTGAEFVRARVESGEARRIALVSATAADVRDTMIEGPAGLLSVFPEHERPVYEPSKRRVTFAGGAVATAFSADEPDRLRGPQHDTAWCDELAAWRYPDDAWDNLIFGMRLGDPRLCVTTTPRPIPLVRTLLGESSTVVTRGSTFDNAANLAASALAKLREKYDGTRLGRQELFAEILTDTPGALWTLATIAAGRVRQRPDLARVVVAVDPAAADPDTAKSEDGIAETGIVAVGLGADRDGYVLRDASDRLSPAEWGERTVKLFDEVEADAIVAEINQGGAMVAHVVRSAAEKLHREKRRASPHVPFRPVRASRGKHTRAEPVAALYEQRRVHHVGVLAGLEDQMATWVPGKTSPDRMDALVWGLTELMLEGGGDTDYRAAAKGLKTTAPAPSDDPDERPRESRRERLRDRSDRW